MDQKTKKLFDKIGGHWALGVGASMLGAIGLITGWLGSRRNEDPDPAVQHLKGLADPIKRHESAGERARWAFMRAGEFLRLALISTDEADRDAFMKGATVYALFAHAAQSASKKALLDYGDAERKMLSDVGVELPAWDRTLDFVRERHNDVLEEKELKAKLIEVSIEIERAMQAKEGTPKDPEKSVWRIGYGEKSMSFADLSEEARAEVLNEHSDWTASSILTGRWVKHEPIPEP
jgi:hypothetical protein